MIVNFINTLALKILILQLSMKCLSVENDCQIYWYIGSKNIDFATKNEVFTCFEWLWTILIDI